MKGQRSMLSMLTLIRGSGDAASILRSVTVFQKSIDAELLVAHPDPVASTQAVMSSPDGYAVPIDMDEMELTAKAARSAFDVVCGTSADCRFKVMASSARDTLLKQSLFADICVLPREHGLIGDDFRLLKAALVDGGTPTVLLPPEPVTTPLTTVVFSWNGQAAAARAIRAAMPFAMQAKRLVVLEHAGNEVNRSRLENFLHRHDVRPAEWRPYGDKDLAARGRARALLAAARSEDCDLMVMGAYGDIGDSFFRFGRATEKVANAARIPVLFSH